MAIPVLSVILPNYNHAHCIRRQLRSILSQSFGDFELIVMDDASTDNSLTVIHDTIKGDPRAHVIQNPTNFGVVANIEKGRSLATGKYLILPAADDITMADSFQRSIDVLDQRPKAGICLSYPSIIRPENPDMIRVEHTPWSDKPTYFSPAQFASNIRGNYISGINVYRSDDYARIAPPLETMRQLAWHADWFMNYAIGFTTGVTYVPEILAANTIHTTSYSGAHMRNPTHQKPVIKAIINLITSERYRHLAAFFIRSNVFFTLPGFHQLDLTPD